MFQKLKFKFKLLHEARGAIVPGWLFSMYREAAIVTCPGEAIFHEGYCQGGGGGGLLSEGLLPSVAIVQVANARGAIDLESATRTQ